MNEQELLEGRLAVHEALVHVVYILINPILHLSHEHQVASLLLQLLMLCKECCLENKKELLLSDNLSFVAKT